MKVIEQFDMTGRVALVTGAASGLGLGFAQVLAANGAFVVMVDVNPSTLADAADRMTAAGLDNLTTAVADVGDPDRLRSAIDSAVTRHGRLDAVFANAGIGSTPGFGSPQGQIENVPLQAWEQALQINLTGAFVTMQAAAAHMKRQRSGSIVVTSSVAALRPSPLPGHAYHATKAAITHLVRQTALELAPFNVRVNAIAPGVFVTNIAGGRLHDPQERAKFAARIPFGRVAEVDEIKGLALYLASSASSYVTGTVIRVDGGTAA